MNEEYGAQAPAPSHDDGPGAASNEQPAAEAVRARLMDQFARWVDRMLAGEPAPEGLAEALLDEARHVDPSDDLYSTVSALTTLSGEVRLQGRAFKQLADALAPLAQTPERLEALAEAQRESARQIESLLEDRAAATDQTADLPPVGQALSVLFDLRERLDRGLRDFERSAGALKSNASGGWRRLLGRPSLASISAALEALRTGYQLTLSRVDAALHQWGIEPLAKPGDRFDPTTMNAVDIEQTSGAEDGAVLEVYQSGYAVHGRVLATARVKVARAKDRAGD